MKLPNMALVFAIIIIPIVLIFSIYVKYQVKTVTTQSTYDSRLVTATKDAVEALEVNTFGDTTKDNAVSTRRNVQASINTFTNSLAANFGVVGYDSSDILSYVPAVLMTMYDGYYIYAPTSEKQENEINQHVLKPYIYYSARYKSDEIGNVYDVVINYSLDNYITISGYVKGEYISMSGYLIDTNKVKDNDDNTITVIKNEKNYTIGPEILYETMTTYQEDINIDGSVNYQGDGTDSRNVVDFVQGAYDGTPVTIKCQYCYYGNEKYYYCVSADSNYYKNKWFRYDQTGHLVEVKNTETAYNELENHRGEDGNIYDNSAVEFYKSAIKFSNTLLGNEEGQYNLKNKIHPENMIKPDNTSVNDTEINDVYHIFADDKSDVLDPTGDNDVFTQHKLNVMQASITYNLNIAISNYANGNGNFLMPEMSETEWNKILTNISMVSFVQGMPMGFKTYNNYAVVTSTNNQMYVGEDSIFYVENPRRETTDDEHHKWYCQTLNNDLNDDENIDLTGYASTEFDMYTVNYLTEYNIGKRENGTLETKSVDHYLDYYRHHSLDCYDCIVNSLEKSETNNEKIEKAKLQAQARIKYNQYKVTEYINNRTGN